MVRSNSISARLAPWVEEQRRYYLGDSQQGYAIVSLCKPDVRPAIMARSGDVKVAGFVTISLGQGD